MKSIHNRPSVFSTLAVISVVAILTWMVGSVLLTAPDDAFAARPEPAPIKQEVQAGLAGDSWYVFAEDSTLGTSWREVAAPVTGSGTYINPADSLRFWSSDAGDSSHIAIQGVVDSVGAVVTVIDTLSGTDTVFVRTYAWNKVTFAVLDTSCAGTVTFKTKTGVNNLFTIPAGQIQTQAASMWFGAKGGILKRITIFPKPFSPMVEYQLRLYRFQGHAWAHTTPSHVMDRTKGYSPLWTGDTGGSWTLTPFAATEIVAALDETSAVHFITSPGTGYNVAAAISSAGTSTCAWYYRSVIDTSKDMSEIVAIDSISTSTVALSDTVKQKSVTLGSATGPWYDFILNGKASAGDTSTISLSITPQAAPSVREPIPILLNVYCPPYSYISLYGRSRGGTGGHIAVVMDGTVQR